MPEALTVVGYTCFGQSPLSGWKWLKLIMTPDVFTYKVLLMNVLLKPPFLWLSRTMVKWRTRIKIIMISYTI